MQEHVIEEVKVGEISEELLDFVAGGGDEVCHLDPNGNP